jgi:hypothetical protein
MATVTSVQQEDFQPSFFLKKQLILSQAKGTLQQWHLKSVNLF